MPLTQQIISEVVKKQVDLALVPVKSELRSIRLELGGEIRSLKLGLGSVKSELGGELRSLHDKIDNLTTAVANFAWEVKKFDEEQVVLAHRRCLGLVLDGLEGGGGKNEVGGGGGDADAAAVPFGVQLVGVVLRRLHIDPFDKVDSGEDIAVGRVFSQLAVT